MNASYAWLILASGVVIFVAVFDVHAHFNGLPTMTGQMQSWLSGEVTGPFIFGGWFGLFAGLMYHFFLRHVK